MRWWPHSPISWSWARSSAWCSNVPPEGSHRSLTRQLNGGFTAAVFVFGVIDARSAGEPPYPSKACIDVRPQPAPLFRHGGGGIAFRPRRRAAEHDPAAAVPADPGARAHHRCAAAGAYSRSVRLTPAGRSFLPEARRILKLAESASQVARRIALGKTGSLKIGFPAG